MIAPLLAVLLAAAAPSEPALAPPSTATVHGLVLSVPSRAPLPFATVAIGDVEALSDEGGRFTLMVPAGSWTLRAVADGHRLLEQPVTLADGEVRTLELLLRRSGPNRAQTVVRDGDRWVESERPEEPRGPPGLSLTPVELERAPGALGDPLRALQTRATVQEDLGAKAAIAPYGGAEDELLVELDDIPLRRRTHLTGLIGALPVELISGLQLSAAPTTRPDSLGGVLAVTLRDGPRGDAFDGVVDLNLLGATAAIGVELDPQGHHRLLVGARQSFVAPYLALADAAGAFQSAPPRGDYGEGVVRYTGGDSRRSISATVFASRDRLLFDDVNERRRTLGGSLGLRLRSLRGLRTTLVLSHGSSVDDEPATEGFDYAHARDFVDAEHRTRLRLRLSGVVAPGWTVGAGAEASHIWQIARGEFPDDRSAPGWLHRPLADLAVPVRVLDDAASDPSLTLHGALEGLRFWGPLSLRLGARAEVLNRALRPTVSPRLQLWAPLPNGTTLSAAAAFLHDRPADPWRLRERRLDAPDLPERAWVVEAGVAQRLGPVHLSLAGKHRALDQLLVLPADVSSFPQAVRLPNGRGSDSTLRAAVRLDLPRLHARASYVLGRAQRRIGDQLVAAGGDRRHGVDVLVEATLGKRRGFVLGGAYGLRSGPAIATLQSVASEEAGAVRWAVQELDRRRRPDRHRIGVRAEHRLVDRVVRLRAMAEVSVLLGGASTEDCPSVPEPGEAVAACRELSFLPAFMPWLGLKADW